MKQRFVSVVSLILFLLSASAFSQNLYLGAGIGNTFFSSEISDAVDQARDISENSTAWKLFGGYHLTDFLNVEGGYRNFGTISSDISTDVFESKTSGWDVEAVGRIKFLIVDLFGKAGAMFWSTEVNFLGRTKSDSGTDFFWGLGTGVTLGPIGVRLEWESVAIGGPENLSMVSLSATLGF